MRDLTLAARLGRTALLFATAATLSLSSRAGELPRHQLQVGQELTFVAENRLERKKAMSKNETVTWTAWVIGKTSDDGWKMVVRRDYFARYTDPSLKGQTLEHSDVHPLELRADGCLRLDPSLDLDTSLFDGLRSFLPLLPQDQAQDQKGYQEKKEENGFRYRVIQRGNQWKIEAVYQGLASEIYEIDATTTYAFDTARGLPIQPIKHNGYSSGAIASGVTITGNFPGVISMVAAPARNLGSSATRNDGTRTRAMMQRK